MQNGRVKSMKKNLFILDIIFYVGLPLFVWHVLRDHVGDYAAMLLTSVPGIIYTLYRFKEMKEINVTGTFILATMVIGMVVDLMSGSALQMLWNNVYYAAAIGVFYLLTMLLKKPLALYFALDMAELQGYDRTFSKHLYFQKRLFIVFQLITFVFALRNVLSVLLNSWLIQQYGVEAFDNGILIKQILGWVMTGLTIIGFIYVGKVIQDSPEMINKVKGELEAKVN